MGVGRAAERWERNPKRCGQQPAGWKLWGVEAGLCRRGGGMGAAAAGAEERVTVTDGAGPGGSFIKRRIRGPRSHLRAEIEF